MSHKLFVILDSLVLLSGGVVVWYSHEQQATTSTPTVVFGGRITSTEGPKTLGSTSGYLFKVAANDVTKDRVGNEIEVFFPSDARFIPRDGSLNYPWAFTTYYDPVHKWYVVLKGNGTGPIIID